MDDGVFSAAALTRLPLADAVWRLLHFTMDDPWLEDLWARERGRCYENLLKFSTLAHLIENALLEHGGSGNQAFTRAQEAEALPVSITSTYEKFGNVPLAVSEGLLDEGSQRMAAVLPETVAVDMDDVEVALAELAARGDHPTGREGREVGDRAVGGKGLERSPLLAGLAVDALSVVFGLPGPAQQLLLDLLAAQ